MLGRATLNCQHANGYTPTIAGSGGIPTISNTLLYADSIAITLWGISHIIPTKSVVEGLGSISEENKLIITMKWAAEGLALRFIGLLVLFVTILRGAQNSASIIVYRAPVLMLIIMAGWALDWSEDIHCTDKEKLGIT